MGALDRRNEGLSMLAIFTGKALKSLMPAATSASTTRALTMNAGPSDPVPAPMMSPQVFPMRPVATPAPSKCHGLRPAARHALHLCSVNICGAWTVMAQGAPPSTSTENPMEKNSGSVSDITRSSLGVPAKRELRDPTNCQPRQLASERDSVRWRVKRRGAHSASQS